MLLRIRNWFLVNFNGFSLVALFRILVLFAGVIFFFEILGGYLFEHFSPLQAAANIKETNPAMKNMPTAINAFASLLITPAALRYAIAPLLAFLIVFGAAITYIQMMYNIRRFDLALRYLVGSLFGLRIPNLDIDGGKKKVPKGEVNVVDTVGGPGFASLQPGNAALFRCVGQLLELPRPLTVTDQRTFFLSRFEQVIATASLEDQIVTVPDFQTMTKDGLQVNVVGLTFRFRISSDSARGKTTHRTQDAPFPYSQTAMVRLTYGQSYNVDGEADWTQSASRLVRAQVSDYINRNNIDILTAPRSDAVDPRPAIRRFVMRAAQNSLAGIGVQLLWVDVGHIDILRGEVDESRINVWAAEWVGDTRVVQAYVEAKRQVYEEQGRAEGQAELIMGIASALRGVNLTEDWKGNVRKILFVRVSQVLEAMSKSRQAEQEQDNKKPL
jgi:hypothetical protein